jgi:hypothetical protein
MRKQREIHGMTNTSEYRSWTSMKNRCYCKTHEKYPIYGGRGITVCDRWLNSFYSFFTDMGKKPSHKHQIDRIDNNGNYEPLNCQWLTNRENNRKRSDNTILEYNGEQRCISEWAELIGVNQQTISSRITRGWSIDKAVTTPKMR